MAFNKKGKRAFVLCAFILVLIVCSLVYWYRTIKTTEIKGLCRNVRVWNTEILFETEIQEIKMINQSSLATVTFNFKNVGDNPLILYNVSSSCGCIEVVEWTNYPIASGHDGKLRVRIDTSKPGFIDKEVIVYSNSVPNPVRLKVKASIKERTANHLIK